MSHTNKKNDAELANRNCYVRAMFKRHKNATKKMKDKRLKRDKDQKNHWSNEWLDNE